MSAESRTPKELGTIERTLERRTRAADRYRERLLRSVCGVVVHSSWHEPVACAYRPDHDGDHSWASIPQFNDLRKELERAVRWAEDTGRTELWVVSARQVLENSRGI